MKKNSAPEVLDDLEALIAESLIPRIQPGDLTINKLRAKAHVSEPTAAQLLEEWVAKGKAEYLGKLRAANGRIIDTWRLIKAGR